jgi:hypothetical protein
VIDEATSDSNAAELANRLSALGEGTTSPTGKECGSVDTNDATVTSDTTNDNTTPGTSDSVNNTNEYQVERQGPQDVLDGVWRMETDRQKILDAGFSASDADANAGIWTITIVDHIATVDQPHGPDCTWDFSFDGNAVSVDFGAHGNDACYGHSIGTFEREGDVVLFSFEKEQDYDVKLDNATFALGMQKIG